MYIYIPILSAQRELDWKLYLSCILSEQNFNVILGGYHYLNRFIGKYRPGIYLAPQAKESQLKMFKYLRKKGFYICLLDEAGMSWKNCLTYINRKLNESTLNYINYIISPNEIYKKCIIDNFQCIGEDKVLLIGHPKVDFISNSNFSELYKKEINYIINKYSNNYILLASSFSSIRNSSNHDCEYVYHKRKVFVEYIKMLEILCKVFPDNNIIIRTHPFESKDIWNCIKEKFNNLYIDNKFSIFPWIYLSRNIIHHYSSISIDSYYMKKGSILYDPLDYKCSEQTKEYSYYVNNIDNLLDLTKGVNANQIYSMIDVDKKYMILHNFCNEIVHLLKYKDIFSGICNVQYEKSNTKFKIKRAYNTISDKYFHYKKYVSYIIKGKYKQFKSRYFILNEDDLNLKIQNLGFVNLIAKEDINNIFKISKVRR